MVQQVRVGTQPSRTEAQSFIRMVFVSMRGGSVSCVVLVTILVHNSLGRVVAKRRVRRRALRNQSGHTIIAFQMTTGCSVVLIRVTHIGSVGIKRISFVGALVHYLALLITGVFIIRVAMIPWIHSVRGDIVGINASCHAGKVNARQGLCIIIPYGFTRCASVGTTVRVRRGYPGRHIAQKIVCRNIGIVAMHRLCLFTSWIKTLHT